MLVQPQDKLNPVPTCCILLNLVNDFPVSVFPSALFIIPPFMSLVECRSSGAISDFFSIRLTKLLTLLGGGVCGWGGWDRVTFLQGGVVVVGVVVGVVVWCCFFFGVLNFLGR